MLARALLPQRAGRAARSGMLARAALPGYRYDVGLVAIMIRLSRANVLQDVACQGCLTQVLASGS